MIYLDHAATTPLDPRVLEEMMPYLTDEFGNPGSLHAYGRAAKEAVDTARAQVAAFFTCKPEQVIFTSGGSEGNSTVFAGLETELRRRGKTEVAVTATEHDSVRKAARKLCIKPDFGFHSIQPGKGGWYGVHELEPFVKQGNAGLVSVMFVNNETGLVNDVQAIGELCDKNGVLFHVDAVQAAGIIPLDVNYAHADFMTISSHKINGPKGVGALFVRNPILLSPLVAGGADQEFGFRGGTENVAGIVGLGAACELAQDELARHLRYLQAQHSQLVYMLLSRAKEAGIGLRINGDVCNMSPKTLNICIPGVDAETLLLLLDARGICISAGSACRAHENNPSHVLKAMGISDDDARSSVRISISHLNTPEELDEAAAEIVKCAAALRGLSS